MVGGMGDNRVPVRIDDSDSLLLEELELEVTRVTNIANTFGVAVIPYELKRDVECGYAKLLVPFDYSNVGVGVGADMFGGWDEGIKEEEEGEGAEDEINTEKAATRATAMAELAITIGQESKHIPAYIADVHNRHYVSTRLSSGASSDVDSSIVYTDDAPTALGAVSFEGTPVSIGALSVDVVDDDANNYDGEGVVTNYDIINVDEDADDGGVVTSSHWPRPALRQPPSPPNVMAATAVATTAGTTKSSATSRVEAGQSIQSVAAAAEMPDARKAIFTHPVKDGKEEEDSGQRYRHRQRQQREEQLYRYGHDVSYTAGGCHESDNRSGVDETEEEVDAHLKHEEPQFDQSFGQPLFGQQHASLLELPPWLDTPLPSLPPFG